VDRSVRIGALAGVVAPALLATVFVGLTIAERGFLDRAGWSPIHRRRVEWPSLLALVDGISSKVAVTERSGKDEPNLRGRYAPTRFTCAARPSLKQTRTASVRLT
jgi:hypothetical protein